MEVQEDPGVTAYRRRAHLHHSLVYALNTQDLRWRKAHDIELEPQRTCCALPLPSLQRFLQSVQCWRTSAPTQMSTFPYRHLLSSCCPFQILTPEKLCYTGNSNIGSMQAAETLLGVQVGPLDVKEQLLAGAWTQPSRVVWTPGAQLVASVFRAPTWTASSVLEWCYPLELLYYRPRWPLDC